jgi:cell division transport system permease protein
MSLVAALSTEMRVFGRILQETMGNVRRTGWMNIIIVVTMASILSIFGIVLSVLLETQFVVNTMGTGLRISVYVADDGNANELMDKIEVLNGVKDVAFISKDEAWTDMQQSYQTPEIPNPLPDTLHIQAENQQVIEPLARAIGQMDGVEKVGYPKKVLKKLEKIGQIVSAMGLAASIFLGLLTLFVISNTVHLLIEGKSREIEILRMMGVGNWYIKLPFLFQGSFYGLMGAVMAFVPLAYSRQYLQDLLQNIQLGASSNNVQYVFWILLLMGVLVGGGGAFMSVRKYLNV